jgi:hypothetical protein
MTKLKCARAPFASSPLSGKLGAAIVSSVSGTDGISLLCVLLPQSGGRSGPASRIVGATALERRSQELECWRRQQGAVVLRHAPNSARGCSHGEAPIDAPRRGVQRPAARRLRAQNRPSTPSSARLHSGSFQHSRALIGELDPLLWLHVLVPLWERSRSSRLRVQQSQKGMVWEAPLSAASSCGPRRRVPLRPMLRCG